MPFYQLKDKYIFLHFKNYQKINDIALKDKEPSWILSSKIQGRAESKEADKLRQNTINKIFKDSPQEDFYNEWIYFDLQEYKYILEDLPYLLYDYSCINKLFSYREIHDDKNCLYELDLFVKGLFRKQEKVFSITLDTREITSVKGELSEFTIVLRDKTLHFGKSITVRS